MTKEYTSKTISVNARFVLLVAWMNEPLLNRAVTRTILVQSFQVQFFFLAKHVSQEHKESFKN